MKRHTLVAAFVFALAAVSVAAEVRDMAVSEGMTTLLQDGIKKAMKGLTDFDQLRRVSMR